MKRLPTLFIPLLLCVLLVGNAPDSFLISASDVSPASANVPVDNEDPSDAGDPIAAEIPRVETRRPALGVLCFDLSLRPESLPPAPAVRPHVWQFRQRAAAEPRAPTFLA